MYSINEIKKEEIKIKEFIKNVLLLANNRVEGIEVYVNKIRSLNVTTRNANLENIELNNSGIITITIYNNNRKASISFTNFNLHSAEKMIQKGIEISNNVSIDKYNRLPDINFLAFKLVKLNLFHFTPVILKNIIKNNLLIEKFAFSYDKKINNTEGTNFCSSINTIFIGNSLGLIQCYKTTCYSLSTNMIASSNNNMQSAFCYTIARDIKDLNTPEYIGKKSAKRAINKLFPKKIITSRLPIIFSSEISSCLFNELLRAINGYNIYQKSSFMVNSLEKKIFPNWLTIIEEPHLNKGIASQPFDNEGVLTTNKMIVSNGILKNWILDSYSSRRLGLNTTGNSGGICNWLITYDKLCNFKQLLKKLNKGILVTEIMGQGVNVTTGDYSKGASGFFVENGEIQYPIDEFTIASNLQQMFLNIVKISNDINKKRTIQCGSILLSEMQISGK